MERLDETTVEYRGSKVYAFRMEWEEDDDKGKTVKKKQVFCHLYRLGSVNQPLNLGEMSDGSKFTAVAQAVNEGKWLVDYYLERELNKKLTYKEMLSFKHLRMSERVDAKLRLLDGRE